MALHKVKWRNDTISTYKKMDAQTVYEEIRSIGSSNGTKFENVSNEEIVDFARNNVNSELHKGFEWNDSIAAENYRKKQASDIKVHLVTIEINQPKVSLLDKNNGDPIEFNVFVSPKKMNGHCPVEIAMQEPNLRKSVVERALDEFKALERRYIHLNELSKIFEAINNVVI